MLTDILRDTSCPSWFIDWNRSNMDGKHRTALITGASGGIGRELAKLLAQDHYDLVLVARDGCRLSQSAGELQRQFGITA
jgi:short-subunit dehydrogenase